MPLRYQLLLLSLLTLLLPWAGCHYAREMESALRDGQEQALLATASHARQPADGQAGSVQHGQRFQLTPFDAKRAISTRIA